MEIRMIEGEDRLPPYKEGYLSLSIDRPLQAECPFERPEDYLQWLLGQLDAYNCWLRLHETLTDLSNVL